MEHIMNDEQIPSLLDPEYKHILLSVFKEFLRLCEKYNLSYFLIAGSLLGAVRHKGMIPWDDDIDVAMPREDYEKFINISRSEFNIDYRLATYLNTNNYYHSCTKLIYSNSTIIERIGPYLCFDGVFIDIFPIDGFPSTLKDSKRHWRKINKRLNQYILACHTSLSECNTFSDLIKSLFYRKCLGYKKILKKWDKVCSSYLLHNSEFACVSYSDYWEREIFPSDMYKRFKVLVFEGFDVRVPFYYDRYLSTIYGDYMKFPPVEKRVLPHAPIIFELHDNLKVEDISSLIDEYNKKNNFINVFITIAKRSIKSLINKIFSCPL